MQLYKRTYRVSNFNVKEVKRREKCRGKKKGREKNLNVLHLNSIFLFYFILFFIYLLKYKRENKKKRK